jgi:hypothetical protein
MFTHEFFEEASKEFMRGKVRVGHMIYYVCEATLVSGKPCGRRASQKDIFADRLCTQHLKCQSKPEKPVKVDECRRSCRLASEGQCRSEGQYSRFGPSHSDGGAARQYSRFGRRLIPAKV